MAVVPLPRSSENNRKDCAANVAKDKGKNIPNPLAGKLMVKQKMGMHKTWHHILFTNPCLREPLQSAYSFVLIKY